MTGLLYIVVGILIFGFLIAIHELGHFLAARACGVRVNEFSIGMGPVLWEKEKGETVYSLRALPFGGFCAMEGEEEDSDDPRALNNKGFWPKLVIFAAGALMNFVAGVVILAVLYSGAQAFYSPTIVDFAEGCPLESEAGLQVGDKLLKIDGERVYVFGDVDMLFSMNTTGVFDLVVERGGEKVVLDDFAMTVGEYENQQGQTYRGYGIFFGVEEATFGAKVKHVWNTALNFVRTVRMSLKMLVTGEAGMKDLSGPVGIVDTMTQIGQQSENIRAGLENIVYLGALIAVNLAVMNLLPLPALDGGKIFFLVLNGITMVLFRKKIPEKFENYVHLAGLILLLALMALITFKDIWKLFV